MQLLTDIKNYLWTRVTGVTDNSSLPDSAATESSVSDIESGISPAGIAAGLAEIKVRQEAENTLVFKGKTITMPQGWTLESGNLDAILPNGSQEQVVFSINTPIRILKIQEKSEERILRKIVLQREWVSNGDGFYGIMERRPMVVHIMTVLGPNSLKEFNVFAPNYYDNAIKAMLGYDARNMAIGGIGGIFFPFKLEENSHCFQMDIGMFPSVFAKRDFKQLQNSNLLTETESNFLFEISEFKPVSLKEHELKTSLSQCVERKQMEEALRLAQELKDLAISESKENNHNRRNAQGVLTLNTSEAAFELGLFFEQIGEYDFAIRAFQMMDASSFLYKDAQDKLSDLQVMFLNQDVDATSRKQRVMAAFNTIEGAGDQEYNFKRFLKILEASCGYSVSGNEGRLLQEYDNPRLDDGHTRQDALGEVFATLAGEIYKHRSSARVQQNLQKGVVSNQKGDEKARAEERILSLTAGSRSFNRDLIFSGTVQGSAAKPLDADDGLACASYTPSSAAASAASAK